jgi:hypothetical protein
LDPIWRAYEIGRDCFKIAKRAVSQQSLGFLNKTDFASASVREGAEWIETSRQESDDLTIVSLWATFERHLVQYLQAKSQKLREVKPLEFGERFQDKLSEDLERWRPDDILDLFKGHVDSNLIGQAKQIKDYRDWIARRNPQSVPSYRDRPDAAYRVLSQIIENLWRADAIA